MAIPYAANEGLQQADPCWQDAGLRYTGSDQDTIVIFSIRNVGDKRFAFLDETCRSHRAISVCILQARTR